MEIWLAEVFGTLLPHFTFLIKLDFFLLVSQLEF
jgi:hypothetical protein